MDYVKEHIKNLNDAEKINFFIIYQYAKKSEKVAYLWCIFTGFLGGHRFYLGHYGTALRLLAITLFTCGLGAVFGWYDAVNIPRITQKYNEELILKTIKVVKRK